MDSLRAHNRRGHARTKPRPRHALSVRSRILVSILATTAIGMAASGIAAYVVQTERARSSVDDQLLHTVSELKSIAEGSTSDSQPTSVNELLQLAMQQLVPSTNEGVVGFVNEEPAWIPPVTLPFQIERDDELVERIISEAHPTNVVIGTAQAEAGSLRYVIIPVEVAGDPDSGLYVAAHDLDAELASVADSFRIYVTIALIALILVAGVGWFVAGRLLRPIRLLRDAATGSSSAADLTERVPVSGRDDVSELAESINSMFDRLQESSLSQRRLLDDIGHELKTPITIIRGHLELLQSGDSADVDATRELTIDELDRMSNLVSEISLLAESQSPRFIEPVEVDLASFTASIGAKASALDPTRSWEVVSADGLATLDFRRMTQAWLQLAENAAKYSPAGTPITLSSAIIDARSRSWLDLSVRDSGPGIPAEARELVFERFQRLDSTKSAQGSGLGLTIVAAIAAAHDGTVLLDEAPGGGSIFTIRIPLSTEAPPEADLQRTRSAPL